VRPVRETLGTLGLRHIMVNCARGSANRDKLFSLTGRFQVPYLQDPNTEVELFESAEIVKYLLDVYTV
jgi:glutathione S-transferase